MKKLVYLIFTVLFLSCSQSTEQEATLYDFGTIDYEEPFRGILKTQPSILRKSLAIPPYKWLAPDTLSLQKTFIIDFNEDAVRSGATATLFFADSLYSKIDGVDFYINEGQRHNNTLTVVADSLTKVVTVVCCINPQVGEKEITGNLFVSCNEIDQINTVPIQQETVNLAEWRVEHKFSIPWLLWLLWLLTAVIMIVCAILVTYYFFKLIIIIAKAMANIKISLANTSQTIKLKNSHGNIKKNDCIQKDDDDDSIIKTLLMLEERLYSSIGVADKYDILEQMRLILDKLHIADRKKFDLCKSKLKQNTWDALEVAWKLWDPTPNNGLGGEWGGLNNMTYTLKKANQYFSECARRNFLKCTYDQHGSPNFDKVTTPGSIVNIEDLYDKLTIDVLNKRGGGPNSLQELAQKRMSMKLEPLIKKWAKEKGITYDPYECFYKWRNENNLVPHEDTNCRTMRLVYRPAHIAFKHRGGIANAKNIKSHFM